MADLIDRAALLSEYDRVHIGPPGRARNLIVEAPAVDAVEVVRCKDCIYAVEIEDKYIHTMFIDGKKQCELGRSFTVLGYSIVSNDGFCDSGEMRTDG